MVDIFNLVAPLINAGLGLVARTRLPRTKGDMRLSGLHGSVEIFRDQWGVPHIYANDEQDLFFAQGFVHAQDRLWQMEFNRRLVAGRLSEVLGPVTLDLDRWMRILTMRRVAEFEVQLLNNKASSYLQAYGDGVNAFVERCRLPIEFVLLGYRPEAWIIADTLAWIKMMSWSLSVNWESEILHARLIDKLGAELASELNPPHLGRWPYIIPPGSDYSYIGDVALEHARVARPFSGPSPYEGLGSNNWVLSGSHTTTGKPIFANDMHLTMGIPSIWYENHLVTKDLNVTGVTFPGIPGVVSGHNGHVAWGYTNGFADVQDLFMERLRRADSGQLQVEYNGKWEDIHPLREEIRVKEGDPLIEEVIVTRHGPIINSLAPNEMKEQPLALCWTSLEPDSMIQGLFEMIRATSCQEFHQALRHWTSPVQNVVYADTAGNIGYTFAGKVPIRGTGDGRVPVPGWTDEYEWKGYIPFEDLPHLENPPQGYIITANNRVVSEDYPIRLDIEPISGDRSQRIAEMILDNRTRDGQEKIDLAFVRKMQFDQYSASAKIVARYLGNLPLSQSPEDEALGPIVRMFKEWDGNLSADSPPAMMYEAFIRKMVRLMLSSKLETSKPDGGTLQDKNDSDLTQRVMGKGPVPILADVGLHAELWLPWLTNLLDQPDSHWYDLGNGEKRNDVMQQALRDTLDELSDKFGPRIKDWTWGRIHQLNLSHVMGNMNVLNSFFNRGPYPIGGDQTTIWATGASYHDLNTDRIIGPPFRMIIDLENLENSQAILIPGQSGNPISLHYDDQINAWFKANYHPILYNRSHIERDSKQLLRLVPQ